MKQSGEQLERLQDAADIRRKALSTGKIRLEREDSLPATSEIYRREPLPPRPFRARSPKKK